MIGLCAFPTVAQAQMPLVFESDGERVVAIAAMAEPVLILGDPSVEFRLDAATSASFRELTGGMVGETLTVSLCDTRLLEAVVRAQLDGVGVLNMPTIEAAIAVANVVKGDANCNALEPHFND